MNNHITLGILNFPAFVDWKSSGFFFQPGENASPSCGFSGVELSAGKRGANNITGEVDMIREVC